MSQWVVQFYIPIEVEADTEAEAFELAEAQLTDAVANDQLAALLSDQSDVFPN